MSSDRGASIRTGFLVLAPGIVVAAVLAYVAGLVAGGLNEPLARNPVFVAMLFGLLLGNIFGCPEALRPGFEFTKRYLLRAAVVLIGFRVTVKLLFDLGIIPVVIAGSELLCVLGAVYWVACRVFKLDRELSFLIACGSAICGVAAILSVATLVRARPQQVGIAITLVTLMGTLALLGYPIAFFDGWLPKFDDEQYGVFVGASIFELGQVYGASYAVSDLALNTATLIKLTKVLMLIPLLLVSRYFQPRREAMRFPFPWFVLAFAAVMIYNSMVPPHPLVRVAILQIDVFLFLMVMVALGLDTRLSRLLGEGEVLRILGTGLVAIALSGFVTYELVRFGLPAANGAMPLPAESAALRDRGGRIFMSVGCGKCHLPSFVGKNGELVLYSDLLLHDMGFALDDKIDQGEATGRDWRTAPLVGLGLRTRYLHDGRADTLRGALLAHTGESEIVRDRFFDLNEADQTAVYRFLNSL